MPTNSTQDPKEIAHPLDEHMGAIHEIALLLAHVGQHTAAGRLGTAYEAIQNWILGQDEDREERDKAHAEKVARLKADLADAEKVAGIHLSVAHALQDKLDGLRVRESKLREALTKIAYQPFGPSDASESEVLKAIEDCARAALEEPQEKTK